MCKKRSLTAVATPAHLSQLGLKARGETNPISPASREREVIDTSPCANSPVEVDRLSRDRRRSES